MRFVLIIGITYKYDSNRVPLSKTTKKYIQDPCQNCPKSKTRFNNLLDKILVGSVLISQHTSAGLFHLFGLLNILYADIPFQVRILPLIGVEY